jgi:hypothetical protein
MGWLRLTRWKLGATRIRAEGGQPSQVRDARLCPVRFAAKLAGMRRWTFRRVCLLMLGLFVAFGVSLSTVQAGNMSVGMPMPGHQMSAGGTADCSACKDIPGGTKMMQCDAACVAPATATLPQSPTLQFERPMDRPLSQSSILSGWTTSPNPHPPKLIALI